LYDPSEKIPKVGGVEMVMLNDKGEIYHATNLRNWLRLVQPHMSIGSGMQYAAAAMTLGQTPLEAVKIASKHDSSTGCGFNKLEMK
jgi:ATP-dependent protease HslVU (ClpYQ) peptidase subunit